MFSFFFFIHIDKSSTIYKIKIQNIKLRDLVTVHKIIMQLVYIVGIETMKKI